MNLIVVSYGPNNMRTDMSSVVELFESAPDTAVAILSQLWFAHIRVHLIGSHCFAVQPLLYFDSARSIVHLVGHICGLGHDRIMYLVNDISIHTKFCVGMGLFGIKHLFDGQRSDCVLAICPLYMDFSADYGFIALFNIINILFLVDWKLLHLPQTRHHQQPLVLHTRSSTDSHRSRNLVSSAEHQDGRAWYIPILFYCTICAA